MRRVAAVLLFLRASRRVLPVRRVCRKMLVVASVICVLQSES